MSVQWHFNIDNKIVFLRSRMEADLGGGRTIVGDVREQIAPGDAVTLAPGLTYDALVAAGGGVLDVADDDTFTITPTTQGRAE